MHINSKKGKGMFMDKTGIPNKSLKQWFDEKIHGTTIASKQWLLRQGIVMNAHLNNILNRGATTFASAEKIKNEVVHFLNGQPAASRADLFKIYSDNIHIQCDSPKCNEALLFKLQQMYLKPIKYIRQQYLRNDPVIEADVYEREVETRRPRSYSVSRSRSRSRSVSRSRRSSEQLYRINSVGRPVRSNIRESRGAPLFRINSEGKLVRFRRSSSRSGIRSSSRRRTATSRLYGLTRTEREELKRKERAREREKLRIIKLDKEKEAMKKREKIRTEKLEKERLRLKQKELTLKNTLRNATKTQKRTAFKL